MHICKQVSVPPQVKIVVWYQKQALVQCVSEVLDVALVLQLMLLLLRHLMMNLALQKKKQKVGDSSASSMGETSRGNQGGGRRCRGHPCGSHDGNGSGSGQGSFHGGHYNMDGVDLTDQNLSYYSMTTRKILKW